MYDMYGMYSATSPGHGGGADFELCCDEALWPAAVGSAAAFPRVPALPTQQQPLTMQPLAPPPHWLPTAHSSTQLRAAAASGGAATAATAAPPVLAAAIDAPAAGVMHWRRDRGDGSYRSGRGIDCDLDGDVAGAGDAATVGAPNGIRIVWEPLEWKPRPPPASSPRLPIVGTASTAAAAANPEVALPPPPRPSTGGLGAPTATPPFTLDLASAIPAARSAAGRPAADESSRPQRPWPLQPPPPPPRPATLPPLQLPLPPHADPEEGVDARLLLQWARAAAGAPAAPAAAAAAAATRSASLTGPAAASAGLPVAPQIAPQRQLPGRTRFPIQIQIQPHQYLHHQQPNPQARLRQQQQQQQQQQRRQPLDLSRVQAPVEAAPSPPPLLPRAAAVASRRLESFPSAETTAAHAEAPIPTADDGGRGGEMPPPQVTADPQQQQRAPPAVVSGLTAAAAAAAVPAFVATRPSLRNHCAQCGATETGGCWRKGWPLPSVGHKPEEFANPVLHRPTCRRRQRQRRRRRRWRHRRSQI